MSEKDETTIEAKLQEPFEPNDIKWRVRQSGIANGKAWLIVLPYITGRAIQKRLDDVFGVAGWQVEIEETKALDGIICTLSLFINGQWVKKQDVAPKTDIEPLKGGSSGALKRAGALAGIGRYLYQLKEGFATCVPCEYQGHAKNNFLTVYADSKSKSKTAGNYQSVDWEPPQLPDWALPGIDLEKFSAAILKAENISDLESAYQDAYRFATSFSKLQLLAQFKAERELTIARLNDEALSDVKVRYDNVNKWLDGKIANFAAIPYAETVNTVCTRTAEELAKKCQGQVFDKEALFTKLKAAALARINIINATEAK